MCEYVLHRKFQHAAVGQRAEECTGDMDQADTAGETTKSVGCEWTDDGKISAEREGERLI